MGPKTDMPKKKPSEQEQARHEISCHPLPEGGSHVRKNRQSGGKDGGQRQRVTARLLRPAEPGGDGFRRPAGRPRRPPTETPGPSPPPWTSAPTGSLTPTLSARSTA